MKLSRLKPKKTKTFLHISKKKIVLPTFRDDCCRSRKIEKSLIFQGDCRLSIKISYNLG